MSKFKKKWEYYYFWNIKKSENEIIVICNKFNLILKRKFYKGDWVSLILEKKIYIMNKNLNKLVKNLTLKESDYYLISTFDEYLYEYVPEYNMRLKFLTNFSGTNGIALISKKKIFFN